jgi:hypothetical protein
MRQLVFSYHQPRSDRRHFVSEDDGRVVLEHLPISLWERLKAVHFNDRAMGRRCLGYVRPRRDEIALCALPPRVSLAACLRRSQSPDQFRVVRGCQWPLLAVRRFMLYDVFLHELGHMQRLGPGAARRTYLRRIGDDSIQRERDRTFEQSVRLDRSLLDANLYLGLSLARENRETEARRFLERAILLDSYAPLAMAPMRTSWPIGDTSPRPRPSSRRP